MKWTDTGGKDFENPEPGTYVATCYKIIDIGTQEGENQGKKTLRRQCIIGWELAEPMSDGRPFVVSKFYTASLSEKANLRKDLAAWRGRDFTPEELAGFESKNIIGKTCLLSLVKSDAGKIQVKGVSKLAKGMSAPPLENPIVNLDLDNFDKAVFDSLSDGVKKIIMQSPEYAAAISGGKPQGESSGSEEPAPEMDDVPEF